MNHVNMGKYSRVTKRVARNLFKEENVFIAPCNLRIDTPFVQAVEIPYNADFDKYVRDFEIYNCTCNETGRYASFYLKVR